MDVRSLSEPEVEATIARIEAFLTAEASDNPLVADLQRAEPADLELGARVRWYVRMRGEEKLVITVWLTVRESSLHYETYVAPAPNEHIAEAFEYALRVNKRLVGMSFCIGGEDAFFLQGQCPAVGLTGADIDRILGGLYAASEETFPTLMRIGYTSSFTR
jgi:hypothetical protein